MIKPFKIVKDNASSIRSLSKEIELPLSKDNEKLALNMLEYLKASQDDEYCEKHKVRSGVGLAAPQIGKNIDLIAIYFTKPGEKEDEEVEVIHLLANPKIIGESVRLCYLESGEGCLSVDGEHKGYVYRHNKVTVKAYDVILKKEVTIVSYGFEAIVLQHEIDHLKGILFYDHIDKDNPFIEKDNSVAI